MPEIASPNSNTTRDGTFVLASRHKKCDADHTGRGELAVPSCLESGTRRGKMTMRFTSVLAVLLAVATLVAFLTALAAPPTISEAAMTGPIFQPDLWKVY
jgi:hypothetical protein